MPDDAELARWAKTLVVFAFRNGPLEDIHSGLTCPTCSGKQEYGKITDEEMKDLMKEAVNRVYTLLLKKDQNPEDYPGLLQVGDMLTSEWDSPMATEQFLK